MPTRAPVTVVRKPPYGPEDGFPSDRWFGSYAPIQRGPPCILLLHSACPNPYGEVRSNDSGIPANTATQSEDLGLLGQLARFGLIGGFCALVDSGSYWLLLQTGLLVHVAKAISFVAGTTTAYFLNRRFTFAHGRRGGLGQVGGFTLLYTVTFFVNVGTNALALHALPEFRWKVALAWIVAQATATIINFIMLKWVIFRGPGERHDF